MHEIKSIKNINANKLLKLDEYNIQRARVVCMCHIVDKSFSSMKFNFNAFYK